MFPVLSLSAAQAEPLAEHQLDVAAVTDFPVLVGGSVAYESPSRLRGEFTAGLMPGPYVSTINWAMTTADVYSAATAELIDLVLQNALILHTQLGFRPWERRGLTVAVGYQLAALAGDTADIALFSEAAIDDFLLDLVRDESGALEVRVVPHMITGEIGYEKVVRERLVLRGSLAFAYTVSADATVTAPWEPSLFFGEEAIDLVTVAAEDYLEYVFEQWVHIPSAGVSVGYRF